MPILCGYDLRVAETAEAHAANTVLIVDRHNPSIRALVPRRMAEVPEADVGRWARMQLDASSGAALYRERFGA